MEALWLLNAPKFVLEVCSEEGLIGGKGFGEVEMKGRVNRDDRIIKEEKDIGKRNVGVGVVVAREEPDHQ